MINSFNNNEKDTGFNILTAFGKKNRRIENEVPPTTDQDSEKHFTKQLI